MSEDDVYTIKCEIKNASQDEALSFLDELRNRILGRDGYEVHSSTGSHRVGNARLEWDYSIEGRDAE